MRTLDEMACASWIRGSHFFGLFMEIENMSESENVKVSIIVPIYNAEKALRRCVDSILRQDFKDFELLLMDDGSKDSSPEICDEYEKQDERVRVFHKPNSGVSNTRNMALDNAKGKYIQFLDADDWIESSATKLLVRKAEEYDADMVIADFYRVVGDNKSPKGNIKEQDVFDNLQYADYMLKSPADYYYGVIWNKLYRREIIDTYHLRMDPEIHWCEDFIFNMNYILKAKRICSLQVPIYYYVKTEGSLVAQGMNPKGIEQMKMSVIDYYRDFYKELYKGTDLYEKNKLAIESFLIAFAHDDFANPIMPKTTKIDEDRVPVYAKSIKLNAFSSLYVQYKLIERYLDTVAMQYNLDINDIKLLLFFMCSGDDWSTASAADFTGISQVKLWTSFEKMILKKYFLYDLTSDMTNLIEGFISGDSAIKDELKKFPKVGFSESANKIFKELELVMADFDNVSAQNISKADWEQYDKIRNDVWKNIKNELQ